MLGQNQDCYAGCFDPETSFSGDLADVRIWDEVLPQVASWPLTVLSNMHHITRCQRTDQELMCTYSAVLAALLSKAKWYIDVWMRCSVAVFSPTCLDKLCLRNECYTLAVSQTGSPFM